MSVLNPSMPRAVVMAQQTARACWRRLIEPADSIRDVKVRRQARLLSTSLLCIIVLSMVGILASRAMNPAATVPLIMLYALIPQIVAYGLSRTRHYQWSALIFVATLSCIPFTDILVAGQSDALSLISALVWTSLTLSIGSLLLSARGLVILTCLNILGMVLLPILLPPVTLASLAMPLGFVAVLAVLTLVGSHHRSLVEQDRLAELTAANRELQALRVSLEQRVQTRTAELAQATAEAHTRTLRQEALYRISTTLARAREENELCRQVVSACNALLGYSYLGIFLLDAETGDRVLAAQIGWEGAPTNWRIPPGAGLSDKAVRTGAIQSWDDVTQEPDYIPGLRDSHSELDVPIKLGDTLLGILIVEDTRIAAFDEDDREVLSAVANQLAIALDNAQLLNAVQRQAQVLSALDQVRTALARELDLPAVLQTVVDTIAQMFKDSRVTIYFLQQDELVRQQIHGAPTEFTRIPVTKGIMGRVARTGKPVLLEDVNSDPDFIKVTDGIVSEICAPLLVRAQVAGVLNVESTHGRKLSEADLRLIVALSEHISVAIGRAQLYTQVRESEARFRRQATYLHVAAEVARVVTSTLDADRVLPHVVDLIRERFGYYHVGVFLLDAARQHAVLHASSGKVILHELEGNLKLPLDGHSIVGLVTRTGTPYVSPNVAADPMYLPHDLLPDTRAEAVIPLFVGETVIGALDVQSQQTEAFSPDTLSILTTMADQIAAAVQNARLHTAEKAHAHELKEAYRALEENQARLLVSEKMASLGRLTAGIAHEMNTPLATVRAALNECAELLEESVELRGDVAATPEDACEIAQEMRQSLQLAANAAERAASFVRGIKVQTRDPGQVHGERFNAVAAIRETLLLLSFALRKNNCKLDFEPAADFIALCGSPGRLGQVVTNLVTNSIDAIAPAGGTITLRLTSDAAGVTLRVSDTGSGIPPDILSRIFDPMFTTKPFGQGTGLGLTIVHDIVTGEFGGSIDVVSQPGQGTTFTLHFPHP